MPQTMRMTSFSLLKPGSKVNLERALTMQSRLGGHIVSGHIDGTGRVIKRQQDDTALWLWIEAPAHIMRYIIDKGSITIQGVSLTVAKAPSMQERAGGESAFAVSLIPHTQGATTLHTAKVGDTVNLENDVIAKYVESFVRNGVSAYETQPEVATQTKTEAFYRDFMLK
jgi:riboflavin synthase